MRKYFSAVLLMGAFCLAFAFDEWQGFSLPFPIRAAARVDNTLILATDGGMRVKSDDVDMVYSSEKGLETSVFYGVVTAKDGVFAVSEFGLVARLREKSDGWDVVNRSFLENKSRVIPGSASVAGDILVIPFEDKVAFVDLKSGLSILSVERIANISLPVYGPEDIEIRGDSLLVSTARGTFVRVMDWENLRKDVRLVDPETWTRVEIPCLRCRDSLNVTVNGEVLRNPELYDENGVSKIRWILEDPQRTFLVGPDQVYKYENGVLEDIVNYSLFKMPDVYELQAIPTGGVIAVSTNGMISLSEGTVWLEPRYLYQGYGNFSEAYNYRMKTLSLLGDELLMYHIWGMGMLLYREWGYNDFVFQTPAENTCMDQIVSNYTVAVGTTVAPDRSGYLTATASAPGANYSLVYITKDGDVSCANNIGSSRFVGPLVARQDPETSDWIVYVSTRSTFDAFATGNLDVFRVPSPSKNGGRLVVEKPKTVNGLDEKTPVDMVVDDKDSVLWLVTATGLGYMEYGKDTIESPKAVSGLSGAEYSSVDVDPHGNVWLGTTNQGVYRLERKNGSFDTLKTSHYTTKNGLLNNEVFDLSIDKSFGMAWFAHSNGVSRYKRNDLREARTFMTDSATAKVKAFPVPFRPRVHPFLTIDNVSEDSRVDIYNRGGSLIRSFAGTDVHGGKVEWDGNGKNGMLVAPGVYYYVVCAGSKREKGKFLVIH